MGERKDGEGIIGRRAGIWKKKEKTRWKQWQEGRRVGWTENRVENRRMAREGKGTLQLWYSRYNKFVKFFT